MIQFDKLPADGRTDYEKYLWNTGRRCEYSFVNLSLWGRQRAAFVDGWLVVFSQFDRKSVYSFPIGPGDGPLQPVLDAIIADAKQRGIPCCISGLNSEKCQLLQAMYPGKFRFRTDRDTFDYVYNIDDLADLKGRKYQKKRNHLNRFRSLYPNHRVEAITMQNLQAVQEFASWWYHHKQQQNPQQDYHLEQLALGRALADPEKLGLEGLVLLVDEKIAAFTMGSQIAEDTFDIHFEKAQEDIDGAYPAINQAFASHLREKYPFLRYLNREDDMGIEGLRKAKLSYEPAFLIEKYWARLWEDLDED